MLYAAPRYAINVDQMQNHIHTLYFADGSNFLWQCPRLWTDDLFRRCQYWSSIKDILTGG